MFSDNLPQWLLGLLIDGILSLKYLGRGSNSGYGRLEIKDVSFEKIIFERKLGEENDNGRIAIIEEERAENLNEELNKVIKAWQNHN